MSSLARALRPASLLGLFLASLSLLGFAQGSFVAGDLYLYNPAFQDISSSGGAIARIDPGSGAVTVFHDLVTSSSAPGQIAYDPWRDQLIFFGGFVSNHNEVYLSDAAGNLTSLGLGVTSGPSIGAFAPRGDGIIYFRGYNNSTGISYFDAANQVQTLMDASGTSPYAFPVGPGNIRHMVYDSATNSLVAATSNNLGTCAGGVSDAVNLRRLDLSLDGTRVLMETCFQYDMDPGVGGEVVVGLAPGPQGDLVLTIDNNNSSEQPRMARVDVAAATATAFAANGNPFAGATNAGCFSQALARAVVLDSFNDVLRAFAAGETGDGLVIATGISSPGSSGEVASLIEIGPGTLHHGMTATPSGISLSAGGTQSWTMDFGTAHAGELYLVLGSATGWNPGLTVSGVLLPLTLDAYTDYTLLNPNVPPLVSTLGFLDPQGQAGAALVLPPASPLVVGLVVHHATIAWSGGTLQATTNPVAVTLLL